MLSVRLVGMCHIPWLLELGDLCKTAATSDVTTVIIVSILVIYAYNLKLTRFILGSLRKHNDDGYENAMKQKALMSKNKNSARPACAFFILV